MSDSTNAVNTETPVASSIPAAADPPALAEMRLRLAETEQLLSQAREALDTSERKRQIERELTVQGAVDVETVAMLTEAAIAAMPKADVRAAIADLRKAKPFLFRAPRPRDTGGAMSSATASKGDGLSSAADEARDTGDRRALLRYLRMRRGA